MWLHLLLVLYLKAVSGDLSINVLLPTYDSARETTDEGGKAYLFQFPVCEGIKEFIQNRYLVVSVKNPFNTNWTQCVPGWQTTHYGLGGSDAGIAGFEVSNSPNFENPDTRWSSYTAQCISNFEECRCLRGDMEIPVPWTWDDIYVRVKSITSQQQFTVSVMWRDEHLPNFPADWDFTSGGGTLFLDTEKCGDGYPNECAPPTDISYAGFPCQSGTKCDLKNDEKVLIAVPFCGADPAALTFDIVAADAGAAFEVYMCDIMYAYPGGDADQCFVHHLRGKGKPFDTKWGGIAEVSYPGNGRGYAIWVRGVGGDPYVGDHNRFYFLGHGDTN